MPDSPFSSPDFLGRDHHAVEYSEELAKALTEGVSSDGNDSAGIDPEPLKDFSADASESVLHFENWASDQRNEHGRLFDSTGREVWRGAGENNRISVPNAQPFCTFTHNHPNGTPPSFEDVIAGAVAQQRELRVVTPSGVAYSIRFEDRTYWAIGAMVSRIKFLDSASWAVAEEWIRSTGRTIDEKERMCRRFHAIFLQLSREGFMSYSRSNAGRRTNAGT
ncbi:hypothetical protein N9V84_05965 [Verrucomicrobiales bacterium]|nr:hypothetical protein [Verrucomicrobiales bacterium]